MFGVEAKVSMIIITILNTFLIFDKIIDLYPKISILFIILASFTVIMLKIYAWYSRTTMKQFLIGSATGLYSVLAATAESIRKEKTKEEKPDPLAEIHDMYAVGEIQDEDELERMIEKELADREPDKSSERDTNTVTN